MQEAETFRWHRHATVDQETYLALSNEHRLIADVVCFPGCHINHLTPRTLDIDRVQELMPKYGIEPKILIEGPPRREVPILCVRPALRRWSRCCSRGTQGHPYRAFR